MLTRYSPVRSIDPYNQFVYLVPDPSGDWTPHDAEAEEIRRLREALEAVMKVCGKGRIGCPCDWCKAANLAHAALSLVAADTVKVADPPCSECGHSLMGLRPDGRCSILRGNPICPRSIAADAAGGENATAS